MDDSPVRKNANVEQQLLDERRERDAAQRRVARLSERVDIWRVRAEERADRIKKLEAERDRLRGARGWLRRVTGAGSGPMRPPPTRPDEPKEAPRRTRPLLPSIRCVTATDHRDLQVAAETFDAIPYDASVSLMEADAVLVDAAGVSDLAEDAVRALIEFASTDVRPPLIVTSDVEGDLARHANSVINTDDLGGRFFDPSQANPMTRRNLSDEALDGLRTAVVDGFGPVVLEPFDRTSSRLLELAAMGAPFVGADPDDMTLDEVRRRSVQFRRFAYERRASELERFTGQLTLNVPTLRPTVAGLVVSNRPEHVVQAIERLAGQRYPNFEVIVGCHGFSASHVASVVEALSETVAVNVIEFAAEMTLGECLNRAIAVTGADVIAKMDDDDHYGAFYITDAVHALEYSGAAIVGKGASYTYVESKDRTVLRRPGSEESFYNGSPTGATLVWTRALWAENPFAHRTVGEDYAFLRGARRLGERIYVNSPFEFVYHRRSSGNTWQAADAVFLAGAEPAWAGDRPWLADVPELDVLSQ